MPFKLDTEDDVRGMRHVVEQQVRRKSLRQIASEVGVAHTTLHNFLHGQATSDRTLLLIGDWIERLARGDHEIVDVSDQRTGRAVFISHASASDAADEPVVRSLNATEFDLIARNLEEALFADSKRDSERMILGALLTLAGPGAWKPADETDQASEPGDRVSPREIFDTAFNRLMEYVDREIRERFPEAAREGEEDGTSRSEAQDQQDEANG
jgi:hypothetical protein